MLGAGSPVLTERRCCALCVLGWVTVLLTDLVLWFVPVFQVPVPQDHLKNKQDKTYVTSGLVETDNNQMWLPACVFYKGVCVCVYVCISAEAVMAFERRHQFTLQLFYFLQSIIHFLSELCFAPQRDSKLSSSQKAK